MRSLKLILLGSIVLLSVSCSKNPSAAFSTDKEEYANGEVIQLKNTSRNAESYEWTGKGISGVLATKDAQFTTNGAGDYDVTLKVYSKNKKKSSEISKIIHVKKAMVPVLFWAHDGSYGNIEVYEDETLLGTVTQFHSSAPDCGATGCVTVNLEEGEHNIFFKIKGITLGQTRTISVKPCFKIAIN